MDINNVNFIESKILEISDNEYSILEYITNIYENEKEYLEISDIVFEIFTELQKIKLSVSNSLFIIYYLFTQIYLFESSQILELLNNIYQIPDFLTQYDSYIHKFVKNGPVYLDVLNYSESSASIETDKKNNNIEPDIFDNDITLGYKYAKLFNISKKYIYKIDDSYFSIINYIYYKIKNEIDKNNLELELPDLNQLYLEISNLTNTINTRDFVFIFYSIINKIIGNEYNSVIFEYINESFTDNDFLSLSNFISEYKIWYKDLNESLNLVDSKLQKINSIQHRLKEIPVSYEYSIPLKIKSTVEYKPLLNSKIPNIDDALYIFDNCVCNSVVPFIVYNNGINIYSKVYTGNIIDFNNSITNETFDYNIIPDLNNFKDSNFIYFYMNTSINKNEKYVYEIVSYDLNKGILNIDSLIEHTEYIFNVLKSVIPILNFNNYKEKNISGEFRIFDISISTIEFLHLINVDDLLNTYLYINENNKIFAEKTLLKLYYKSFLSSENKKPTSTGYISNTSDLAISLYTEYTKKGDSYKIVNTVNNITDYTFQESVPYLYCKYTKASNETVVIQFINLFIRFLKYYTDRKNIITNLYLKFFPDIFTNNIPTEFHETKENTNIVDSEIEYTPEGNIDIKTLNNKYQKIVDLRPKPKITKNQYTRTCQSKIQPVVVPQSDKKMLESIEFVNTKNVVDNLEVHEIDLDFVDESKKSVLLACVDSHSDNKTYDKSYYLYFKENKYDPEQNLVPCCGKTKHTSIKEKIIKSEKTIESEKSEKIVKQTLLKTKGTLKYNSTGELSNITESILKKYNTNSGKFSRLGVVNGKNSLLHCILTALEDKPDNKYTNYKKLETIESKEEYINLVRQKMYRSIKPALCSSELYNLNTTQIYDELKFKILDPNLHFRALEEFFNINIYTFSENKQGIPNLEIPNHKLSHFKIYKPDRPVILIFRSIGLNNNVECNLIIDNRTIITDKTHSTQTIKYFDYKMNELMYNLFLHSYSHYNTSYNIINKNINTNYNIFNILNYNNLFKNLETQIIDSYGKARAFNIRVNDKIMTVITPPTTPLNLEKGNINYIDPSIAMSQFETTPIMMSLNSKGISDGLWFKCGDFGLYVPTTYFKGSLPIGPNNPILNDSKNYVQIYNNMLRCSKIFYFLIKWVYIIYLNLYPQNKYTDFVKLYFALSETQKSDYVYDCSRVLYTLPQYTNIENALQYIHEIIPSLCNKYKFIFYDSILYERIVFKLKRYDYTIEGLKIQIPKYIDNFYDTEFDFKTDYNVRIFLNINSFSKWLNNTINKFQVYNYLSNEFSRFKTPYGYVFESTDFESCIYLINNTETGTISAALGCSYYYNLEKINFGYYSHETPIEYKKLNYNIYKINELNSLELIESNIIDEFNPKYNILQYNNGTFASLLKIV